MRVFLLSLTLLFFTGCFSTIAFNGHDQKTNLALKVPNNIIDIKFTKPKYTYTKTSCVDNSYTIADDHERYGKLFIEYVDLDNRCEWKGLASGHFVYEYKKQLKLESLERVESVEKAGYVISTYRVNKSSYINIIYDYKYEKDIMIVDHLGVLSEEILTAIDAPLSQYRHEKRFETDYNYSLVKFNLFFNYFNITDEGSEIILPQN